MSRLLSETSFWMGQIWTHFHNMDVWVAIQIAPLFFQIELLINVLVIVGVFAWWIRDRKLLEFEQPGYHPGVSCIVTCYSEGNDVIRTIRSLASQLYDGPIEIIAVVDGSVQNHITMEAVKSQKDWVHRIQFRRLVSIGKSMRGGRVSSLNTGLKMAHYEIIMVFDGDTSFTNDTVRLCARHFADSRVVAVSGNLRIRNRESSLATRLQALEYNLGIALGRTGLAVWGTINNISGAFGCFRRSLLEHVGGWDSGTAEDLDLTTRIKGYFGRHPELRIAFEPYGIGFTDGPESFAQLIRQRERWDGDLSYLYLRKFRQSFDPSILGWRNFLLYLVVGLVFQIVVPFLVWIYYIRMLILYPVSFVLAISLTIYLVYLALAFLLWIQYMLLVSRFRKEDFGDLFLLPLQPLYSFGLRVMMVPFTLKSLLFRSHLDSGMAPYWVLRKGGY